MYEENNGVLQSKFDSESCPVVWWDGKGRQPCRFWILLARVRVVEMDTTLPDEFPSLALAPSTAAPRPAGAWGGDRSAVEVLAAAGDLLSSPEGLTPLPPS